MRVTSSLLSLFLILLASLQRTYPFLPSISHPSRLHTTAPSLPSKYCPMTSSYFPAPHSRDRTTCSLFVASASLKRTLLTPRASSSGKARLNRSPGSPRKRWWAKHCVRQRTFTSKERKGSKCMGMSSNRTAGRKATRESGLDYCSFTEACRRLRIQYMYRILKRFTGPQGAWDDQWSTRWNPNVFSHQEYFVVAINPTGSTTFGQGSFSSILACAEQQL